MTRPDQSARRAWAAEQVGHRLGALALIALCAGLALMLAGKRPFPSLLACGFAAATIATTSSLLASRWHAPRTRGLIAFNWTLFLLTSFSMLAGRLNWWHLVGLFAGSLK